jgi:signal transduction histidine kinase
VAHLHAVDAVAQIFHAIPDLATPAEVESSLRRILDDPALELYWWDWEHEGYVDVDGVPSDVAATEGRVVTFVGYESRRIGALVHDPRLLEDASFLETFVPTMRIAMERDRLHRDLMAKLDQLRASRQRIVAAAEEERRRLERNLHDGAQQRLVVSLLALRRLEELVRENDELAPIVLAASQELEGAVEDLRELARGLHPPLLRRHGLAAAVRAAAARTTLPVELDLGVGEGLLPPAVEAAVYYVCAEALTNAVKHAGATRVWIVIAHSDAILTVELRDDGSGGASGEGAEGTGLGGLRDRVEALDGTLTIDSPPGRGTRLVATFPLSSLRSPESARADSGRANP